MVILNDYVSITLTENDYFDNVAEVNSAFNEYDFSSHEYLWNVHKFRRICNFR